MKLGILNEFTGSEKYYIAACEELGIDYEVIDIISTNWMETIKNSGCDGFLVRPSYAKQVWNNMYDEKLYFINKILKKPIYPSYDACYIYEDKKRMAYWLEAHNIPHAKTSIFYNKKETIDFLEDVKYPLVFKPNTGSAAIGIQFIKNKKEGLKLTNRIFTKWRFFNLGYTKWVKTRYGVSYPIMDDKQYNFIIFQDKMKVKIEWRIIKIGESYFGHQKLEENGFHSGSGSVGWVDPPKKLLNMAKDICDKGNFRSMDVDIFETEGGEYYVNELQTIFGSYDLSQMYVNGKPGRYKFIDKEWVFEEGFFNQNYSCNLRVEDFIKVLKGKRNI